MSQRFQIVPPWLFPTQMRVDAHIACRSWQTFSFSVRYMLLCFGVPVMFRHAKVDHVHHRFLAISSNQKVVRLNISVDQVMFMHTFESCHLRKGKTEGEDPVQQSPIYITISFASMATVFTVNRLEQASNRSSRLAPRRSITSTLCNPSWPYYTKTKSAKDHLLPPNLVQQLT